MNEVLKGTDCFKVNISETIKVCDIVYWTVCNALIIKSVKSYMCEAGSCAELVKFLSTVMNRIRAWFCHTTI